MAGEDFRSVSISMAYRIIHPRPAILVISSNSEGKVNGMIAAWTTPISRDPPLLGVSIAPSRYTHEFIEDSKEFTLNILDKRYVKEVHFLGTVSGRDRDKLAESGLTLRESRKISPPHVAEALAVIECKVERGITIGDHTLFIGRIVDAYAKKDVFDETYLPEKAKILLHLGGADYVTISDETIRP